MWIRLWIFSVDLCENRLEQISQPNGRSPVWVRWWMSRYGFLQNAAGQRSQRNGRFPTALPPTNKSTIHFWIAMVKWRMKRRRCIWIWIIYLFSFRMIYDLNSNFNHFCAFICQKMDVTYFVYECVRVILFQICWLKLDGILRMIRLHEMVRCIYIFFWSPKESIDGQQW